MIIQIEYGVINSKMSLQIEKKRFLYAFFFPALFIVILWFVWALAKFEGTEWTRWGIFPRERYGIWGIFTSPFIHADMKHLFSNTVPLLILGWCLFYFYRDLGCAVFPVLWILSGLFTWILGRDSWHIGASGLTYSLTFFLFFSGIFRRHIPLMAVSLIVVFLYGSTIWSMFPIAELVDPSISWEGHLSGAISGLLCALIFRKQGPQKPEPEEEEEEEEEDEPEIVEENLI